MHKTFSSISFNPKMAERAISRKNFLCFCALKYAQLFIFCLLFFHFSIAKSAIDTITPNQNITVGETLVSGQKVFELGFFSPDKASPNKRYLGIWYYEIQPLTVVWVANTEKPVLDNHGVFGMTNNGELQVMDGKGRILWSPANSNSTAKPGRVLTAKAKLLDNGNLVLQRGEDIPYHWESYKDESNTFLPGMNTENKFFRSWKSDSDPAPGDFTLGVNKVWKQFTIRNSSSSDPVWESGWSQNSVNFNEVPANLLIIMFPVENFTLILDNLKTARLVLNSSGQIVFHRRNTSLSWNLSWKGPDPEDECSMYQVCGNYGICNNVVTEGQKCKCLKGFMPDSTGGCRRKAPHEDCSNDYFVKISLAKVWHPDDDPFPANSEEECREVCKTKCCNAYLFEAVRGQLSACWTWQKDETLKDLKNSSTEEVGGNLWVRVENNTAPSGKCDTQNTSCIQPEQTCKSQEDCKQWPSSTCEPNAEGDGEGRCVCISSFHWNFKACVPVDGTDTVGSSRHSQPLLFIILLSNTAGIVLLVVGLGCLWRRMAAGKGQRNSIFQKQESDRGVKELLGIEGFPEDRTESIDVPFFSFETIVAATEDFSVSNKLGQGGFGPVYKGKFPGGKEIAVKRLSRSSGQGLDEFKNEVVLIAKLQHRNLVRLLGYCMRGDEKMLIYEYMPNKSLDAIIFDPEKCQLLNWEMRYNIIVGVARGLLYLHQDSRLRIIHRDLKTSNILLDEDMNPKISDFGMARLFGGKQIEANTTRVAGTYGYMSPEYAIDGLFSIKSDVFSFGVVALEILSGKRNALFYHKEQAQTLLGYAWKLWYEDTGLDLMDPSLREDYNEGQALKCIQIALLCVQDDAADRPTMTEVVSMLSSENVVVPNPKQPIFYVKRFSESLASSSNQGTNSNNELTVTFEGR